MINQFIHKAFLNTLLENWNQDVHTTEDIGLQGNQCSASLSTLILVFSKTWRQENNSAQIDHLTFNYNNNLHDVAILSVQYDHKFPDLSTFITLQ